MKKDVWLTIRSRQHFAGCDEERVNLETAATLYERGGKYYIAYEESELTGLEGTKTTVKLDGKTVTLIRTGTFPSHMLFSEDERHIGLIVTTGGTGLSPRDVTPEATLSVLDREIRAIPVAMWVEGLKITPRAMLSRAVAGTRGSSLILNLPGSEKAEKENLSAVIGALEHAMHMIAAEGH